MVLNTGDRPVGAKETAPGVFRMTEIGTAFTSGVTLPASPEDGDRHYWTGAGANEWFYYDDGRSSWLSDRVTEYAFGNASGEPADYVTKLYGRMSSATVGHVPSEDLVLLSVRVEQNYTHATQLITLWVDGAAVAASQIMLLGVYDAADESLNIAIPSGAVLACKAARASTAEHVVRYTLRRTVS